MTQITISELTAIVWREREKRRGKVIAYAAVSRPTRAGDHAYQVGVAILGENGYALPVVPMLHASYEGASDMADTLNTILGHAPETSIAIIADTMSRSRYVERERERNAGWHFFEVKLSLHSGEEPDEEGLIYALQEAIESMPYIRVEEHGHDIAAVEVRGA